MSLSDVEQEATLPEDDPTSNQTPADVEEDDATASDDEDEMSPAVQEQRNIVVELAEKFLNLFRRPPDPPAGAAGVAASPPDPRGPIPFAPRMSKKAREQAERELQIKLRAKEKIEERLERYRQMIQDFEEDRENLLERGGRWFFLVLAYVGPILVALAFGKEIGDAYGGPFTWDGWSLGMHTGSYFGELALAMMSLTSATALRRMQNDRGYVHKLILAVLFFLLFTLASGLAQWFIALKFVDINATGGYAALVFRVAMPAAVDIASLLYISVMKLKSLKQHLANLRAESDALKQLNEAELDIRKSQNYAKQLEAREQLLMDIESLQAKAVLKAVEKSLNDQTDTRGYGYYKRTT